MRIIDKLTDFYDFYQDPTDTIVFDRRGSFIIDKEDFGQRLYNFGYFGRNRKHDDYRLLLLQCGCDFWFIFATIEEHKSTNIFEDPKITYELELLKHWKNYNKARKLLNFQMISFSYKYKYKNYDRHKSFAEHIHANLDVFIDAIDHNDFEAEYDFSTTIRYIDNKDTKVVGKYPILRACGIGTIVDPLDIFTAIEEYFSMEKTSSETTEPKGATNDDKIIMHGFDTKSSFRNKK